MANIELYVYPCPILHARHGQLLIYGNNPTEEISYQAQYDYLAALFTAVEILSRTKTHSMRGQGAKDCRAAG